MKAFEKVIIGTSYGVATTDCLVFWYSQINNRYEIGDVVLGALAEHEQQHWDNLISIARTQEELTEMVILARVFVQEYPTMHVRVADLQEIKTAMDCHVTVNKGGRR